MDLENCAYLWKNSGYAPACSKLLAQNVCCRAVTSLPVGVGVFLRRENPEFAILAAILENTRRGGAGRAIVDKEATRRGGGREARKKERGFSLLSPSPFPRFLRSPARPRDRAS